MKATNYLAREQKIARAEHGGMIQRWEYGHSLLALKAGRKQLPHGLTADLIRQAERAGLHLSEREIRRRVALAEAYPTRVEVGHAVADFGSWRALAEAGFPPVEVGTVSPLPAPDQPEGDALAEQLVLLEEVFPALVPIGRTRIPLATATLRDLRIYADEMSALTERYAAADAKRRRRLAQLVHAARGDMTMSYAEAVRRAADRVA